MTDTQFPDKARMFYCIGAQKAGTSWLYQALGQSRDCHLPYLKELHYFDALYTPGNRRAQDEMLMALDGVLDDLIAQPQGSPADPRKLIKAKYLADYLKMHTGPRGSHDRYIRFLTQGWAGQALICDITPAYSILDRKAFADMAGIGRAQFLFILRDPVERMWSAIRMAMSDRSGARGLDKDQFAGLCADRVRRMQATGALGDKPAPRADYLRTLAELDHAVDDDRVHVAFFETLVGSGGLADLCARLGIAPPIGNGGDAVGVGRQAEIPEETEQLLFDGLKPQYDGIMERFGDAVPDQWRTRYDRMTSQQTGQ